MSNLPSEQSAPELLVSPGGLRRLAMRGAAFELGAYGVSYAVRFVNSVILTRLVATADVGTALLVSTLHLGLVMVTDAGFLQAMMQSKRGDDPQFLDTIWTLQAIRGRCWRLLASWSRGRTRASTTPPQPCCS